MSEFSYHGKRGRRNAKADSVLGKCGYAKGGAVALKCGGRADGEMGKHKMDKYARGGKVKGTTVNVIVAGGGGGAPPGGAPPMPTAKPPMPPMAGPPPGAGAMPPPPMGRPGMKSGGRVKQLSVNDGGAGSGKGRLKKAKLYGG